MEFEKTIVITAEKATAIYNAIMAKAKDNDTIDVEANYLFCEATNKPFFTTRVSTVRLGKKAGTYTFVDIYFWNGYITVNMHRNGTKHSYYNYRIHG